MRYAETLLSEGEMVVVRSRQHWLALLLDARTALALWVVAAVLLLSVLIFGIDPPAGDIMSWAAAVALVVGLVLFGYRFWQWWAQDYLVTNRRLMKVEGILNKRSADSSLEKINDAVLDQNIIGRIFDYGDLDILTAADTGIDRYRMLNHAKSFKREMLNQKHALEMEYSYRQPPSPPLRATSAGREGELDRSRGQPAYAPAGPDARTPYGQPAPGAYASSTEPPPPAPAGAWVANDAARQGAPAVGDGSREGHAAVTQGGGGGGAPGAEEAVAAGTASPPTPARPDEQPTGATSAGGPRGDRDDSREITQTLARLADLRDRGAITAEEYEAKKDELLGRL
jgi:hypothetical protein